MKTRAFCHILWEDVFFLLRARFVAYARARWRCAFFDARGRCARTPRRARACAHAHAGLHTPAHTHIPVETAAPAHHCLPPASATCLRFCGTCSDLYAMYVLHTALLPAHTVPAYLQFCSRFDLILHLLYLYTLHSPTYYTLPSFHTVSTTTYFAL